MDSVTALKIATKQVEKWADQFMDWLNDIEADKEAEFGKPRELTNEDIDGWFETAYNPLKEKMEMQHPYRWWRFKRDLKWIRREMRLLNLNPNDLKWWVG